MKKMTTVTTLGAFLVSGCTVYTDETNVGKFALAYKSNIQRKLDNQYYTEAEASLTSNVTLK